MATAEKEKKPIHAEDIVMTINKKIKEFTLDGKTLI